MAKLRQLRQRDTDTVTNNTKIELSANTNTDTNDAKGNSIFVGAHTVQLQTG